MEPKPCSRCSRPADFSLALLLSTIRIRPRVQKCSQTIALCNSCIHDVLASSDTSPLTELQQRAITAYAAIADPISGALDVQRQHPAHAEPHSDGGGAVSRKTDKPISTFEEIS